MKENRIQLKKGVALTPEAIQFLDKLELCVQRKFSMIRDRLAEKGFLVSPYGEKVEGYTNLFAIRIQTGNNVRFFYYYADESNRIWILNGYEKRTDKIPMAEIQKALKIKQRMEG